MEDKFFDDLEKQNEPVKKSNNRNNNYHEEKYTDAAVLSHSISDQSI